MSDAGDKSVKSMGNENENNEMGDEVLRDEEGNPINPEDLLPKEPQNPLKKELLQKSLSKLSKTYGIMILIRWVIICIYCIEFTREGT